MIRLTYVLRRLPSLSRAEFQQYWRNTHGPLVAKHATTLACRKYVQVHTLEDPLNASFAQMRGSLEPYDGVAKLWWNTKEELQHVVSTSAGRHAASELLDDEKRFIDFSRSSVWLAIALPQVNPTPEDLVATENSPIVALFYCFRHLPTLSLEEAQLYWRMQHGPLVRRTHTPSVSAAIYKCTGPTIPSLTNCGAAEAQWRNPIPGMPNSGSTGKN
jgi:uncharacterized protein (TIGR02118 family)